MKDSQLLSTYADSAGAGSRSALRPKARTATAERTAAPNAQVLVFDVCHAGVVLRAFVGMAGLLIISTAFTAPRLADAGLTYTLQAALTMPGLLAWLIVCCLSKHGLAKLPEMLQWTAAIALGALAGLLSHAFADWAGLLDRPLWLGFALAAAAFSALLVAGLMWRAKAQMPAATQARLVELQARIRPHFLFNALNSAMALVRDDPPQAERVLEDLSDLFRQALADPSSDVSLGDEIELARSYLNIEQIRFGERMDVQWAIDESASSARVPPLILQPLVENAVKHGVERSGAPTVIKVSTLRRPGVVVIRVTNSLPTAAAPALGEAPSGNGMALANVRERLALLHDLKASFRAQQAEGMFQARIEVPL